MRANCRYRERLATNLHSFGGSDLLYYIVNGTSFLLWENPYGSIFTVHAGEFIVGEYIERTFKGINVWVPTKDTGVNLLVTNSKNTKAISFQVKFSRDYLTTHLDTEFQSPMRVCGWFALNPNKIEHSTAHYWAFVLVGSKARFRDYVVIKPLDMLNRLKHVHPQDYKDGKFQVYIWVTEQKRCWETRGLSKLDQSKLANGTFSHSDRDLTAYLNNWEMLETL